MTPFKKIAILESDVQAQLLDDVLNERGVPHVMKSYHDSAYDGIFQTSRGWGHVEAPAEYAEQILKLIEDLPAPLEGEESATDGPSEPLS